jgi:tRNA(fMet)-specific endonuclease VapC
LKRYLLDTGIASDYINRRRGVFERASDATHAGGRLGIATVVLGELLAGIELSDSRDRNLARLQRHLNALFVWPFDNAAAFVYGRIYADLQRRGRLITQNDMQIAAIAMALNETILVTKDSDFNAIAGLTIVDWSKP